MDDLFTKPVPLLRPKKSFYQKPTLSPTPKKLAHSPIDISSTDIDKSEEKEMMKKISFAKEKLLA